jgi:hypothetical protein
MNNIAKVLIIEKNCAQLIALTVWLKQFPELHVQGTMSADTLKQSIEKDSVSEYDLVIYGLEIGNSDEVPLELAMALSLIRKIKSRANRPAIILLCHYLTNNQTNNITAQISQQLLRESNGQLYLTDSLVDFHHEIIQLLSSRRAASILTARAG